MTRAIEISHIADIIDARDIISRFEELETALQEAHERGQFASTFDDWVLNSRDNSDPVYAAFPEDGEQVQSDIEEFYKLNELLGDIKGNGGDEHWRGDWYPITLIRDSHFVDAMRELCEDIGDFPNGVPHYYVIDWEATARNLRMDYSAVEFDGVTYWYR